MPLRVTTPDTVTAGACTTLSVTLLSALVMVSEGFVTMVQPGRFESPPRTLTEYVEG